MSELINSFAEWIRSFGVPDYLVIFIISLFPILELRGGLIAAAVLKLKLVPSFIVCFIGNILPISSIIYINKNCTKKGEYFWLVLRYKK